MDNAISVRPLTSASFASRSALVNTSHLGRRRADSTLIMEMSVCLNAYFTHLCVCVSVLLCLSVCVLHFHCQISAALLQLVQDLLHVQVLP